MRSVLMSRWLGPATLALGVLVIAPGCKPAKKVYTVPSVTKEIDVVRNAQTLAHSLIEQGFKLVSGGTDNHLMLVDLRDEPITGRHAADLLESVGIIVNKNVVPFDTRGPHETSGIRPGTPAVTTRGMREPEMVMLARMIGRVLRNPDDEKARTEVSHEVTDLCKRFPIYVDINQ